MIKIEISDSKVVKSDALVDLTASTYYYNASKNIIDKCYRALNVTWTMNPNGE